MDGQMENYEISAQVDEVLSEFTVFYDGNEKPAALMLYDNEKERILRLERSRENRRARVTVLSGRKGSGRRLVLKHAAYQLGRCVLFTDGDVLLQRYMSMGTSLIRMLEWKARQVNSWLCICDRGSTEDDRQIFEQFLTRVARDGYSCFITVEEGADIPCRSEFEIALIKFRPPGLEERAMLWSRALSRYEVDEKVDAWRLARQYTMTAGMIAQVTRTARLSQQSCGGAHMSQGDIRDAADTLLKNSMGSLARQVPCVYTWEDFVADKSLSRQLRNLCSYVLYQNVVAEQWGFGEKRPHGNGTLALFYGPPGTGKTMAAQVIAGELGLLLYRVDLSQINSKYIGETQKNISDLFERAREKNVLLFFDEADALFSRRTQVKDANDRHANGEIAHLLQQLEEYDGITILATNLKSQIDEAFRRRIKTMIGFRLPDSETRRKLWRKAVPDRAPVDKDVDLDFYADHFELSAGEIKETVRNAAFLAASAREQIGNAHLREALETCFEKYGRVLSDTDFKGQEKEDESD